MLKQALLGNVGLAELLGELPKAVLRSHHTATSRDFIRDAQLVDLGSLQAHFGLVFLQEMAQEGMAGGSLERHCPTYIYKVVLLGSTAVGKSSLAYRYVKNDFQESLPTVGCE